MKAQADLIFLLALLAFYLAFGIGPVGDPTARGVFPKKLFLGAAGGLLLVAAGARLLRKGDRL